DNDGRRLAYQISHGGDEEAVLQVMDVASGERLDGPIDRCRYTQVAWLPGGEAYYYVRRLAPEAVPADEAQYHHRVYLHTVGTAAEADVLVLGEGRDKTDYYQASVSWDGGWLAITAAQGTSPRTDVWLADLAASSPAAPALRVVQAGVDARTGIHVGRDGRAYVFTDAGAPRGRLAVADPSKPEPSGWRDLIAEDPEAVLEDFAILDGEQAQPALLIAVWTRHGFGEITVHDLADGTRRGVISVPGPPAGGTRGRPSGPHQPSHQPAGGGARGVVRLHRPHPPGHHLPLRRPARGGRARGACPRLGADPAGQRPPGHLPLGGWHRGKDGRDRPTGGRATAGRGAGGTPAG